MKIWLLPLIIFSSLRGIAQTETDIAQDSSDFVLPIYYSYSYNHTFQYKFMPCNGSSFSLGINVAGFFGKQFIIGPVFEVRSLKIFGSYNHYRQLTEDINGNLKSEYAVDADSVRIQFLRDAFNNHPERRFFGSTMANYGIMISPFPYYWGGVMVMLKKGSHTYVIDRAYGFEEVAPSGEYTYLDIPYHYRLELMFKPFCMNGPHKNRIATRWRNMWHISFYYERVDMTKAHFAKRRITNLIHQPFFDKYNIDHQFGVRVSFGMY